MAKLNQSQLLDIFNALKSEIKPFEQGFVKARFDLEGKYDLWSEKPEVLVQGKVRNEISFVGIILQSDYVGFYYMPIYTHTITLKDRLSPELLKLLKGKSCFHFRSVDESVLKTVRAAMELGFEAYQKAGWV